MEAASALKAAAGCTSVRGALEALTLPSAARDLAAARRRLRRLHDQLLVASRSLRRPHAAAMPRNRGGGGARARAGGIEQGAAFAARARERSARGGGKGSAQRPPRRQWRRRRRRRHGGSVGSDAAGVPGRGARGGHRGRGRGPRGGGGAARPALPSAARTQGCSSARARRPTATRRQGTGCTSLLPLSDGGGGGGAASGRKGGGKSGGGGGGGSARPASPRKARGGGDANSPRGSPTGNSPRRRGRAARATAAPRAVGRAPSIGRRSPGPSAANAPSGVGVASLAGNGVGRVVADGLGGGLVAAWGREYALTALVGIGRRSLVHEARRVDGAPAEGEGAAAAVCSLVLGESHWGAVREELKALAALDLQQSSASSGGTAPAPAAGGLSGLGGGGGGMMAAAVAAFEVSVASQLMSGGDLLQRATASRYTEDHVRRVGAALADALAVLDDAGVTSVDLAPWSLMYEVPAASPIYAGLVITNAGYGAPPDGRGAAVPMRAAFDAPEVQDASAAAAGVRTRPRRGRSGACSTCFSRAACSRSKRAPPRAQSSQARQWRRSSSSRARSPPRGPPRARCAASRGWLRMGTRAVSLSKLMARRRPSPSPHHPNRRSRRRSSG